MLPGARHLAYVCRRVCSHDLVVEFAGVVPPLVANGRVGATPVQPERERQRGELRNVGGVKWRSLVPLALVVWQGVEQLADRPLGARFDVVEDGALVPTRSIRRSRADLLEHPGRELGRRLA